MKNIQFYSIIGITLIWILGVSFTPEKVTGNLVIEISNIKKAKGTIWMGIYDSEDNYMIDERAIIKGVEVDKTGKLLVKIPMLKYGTYAIGMYHDLNNNGEIDRNFIGIPSEPWAFSKKPKSRWRLPKFKEVTFDFKQDGQVLKTRLRKW